MNSDDNNLDFSLMVAIHVQIQISFHIRYIQGDMIDDDQIKYFAY